MGWSFVLRYLFCLYDFPRLTMFYFLSFVLLLLFSSIAWDFIFSPSTIFLLPLPLAWLCSISFHLSSFIVFIHCMRFYFFSPSTMFYFSQVLFLDHFILYQFHRFCCFATCVCCCLFSFILSYFSFFAIIFLFF